MTTDHFEDFLRKNASPVPQSTEAEKHRLWRKIQQDASGTFFSHSIFELLRTRWVLGSFTAVAAAFLVFGQYRHVQRQHRIDRILSAVVAFDILEQQNDPGL